jgi:O-antigen/teichoic acid export membrane protein
VPFLLMSLGFTVVQTLLLVIAVLHFKVGLEGLLFVSCATNVFFGLLGLYFVRGFLVRPSGFKRLREMLPFALPFGVICLLGAFSPTLERILIDHMLGSDQLGLYAAGTKVAMLIGIVVGAFQTAWGPFSLSLHRQADAAETFNSVLKIFVWLMSAVVLGIGLLAAPILDFLASDRYTPAAAIVFPLAMGLAIQATGWITEIGIVIAKKSAYTLYANVLALVCTICGILLLAPAMGLWGVGVGVMIGHAARATLSAWLAQKVYPQPWQYGRVVTLLSLSFAVGLFATWAQHTWGAWAQTLCFAIGLLLVITAGWGFLLSRSERLRVINVVNSAILRVSTTAYPKHPEK